MPREHGAANPLVKGLTAALLWCAAFAYASTWFLSATKLWRGFPPTPAVAIGILTVEQYAKTGDYFTAAMFYLLVPALTVLFVPLFRRGLERLLRPAGGEPGTALAGAALLTLPLLLAPLFFLTTRKEMWGFLLPLVLAAGAVRALVLLRTRAGLRRLFAREVWPYHWLLVFEALAWLMFRYLTLGKRIAHIPTLFLEIVFLLLFVLLFWGVAVFAGRMMSLLFGRDPIDSLKSFAVGAIPLLLLPVAGLTFTPVIWILAAAYPLTALTLGVALWRGARWNGPAVHRLIGYAAAPLLIFCLSYSSTAQLSQWIDLFHRGESLGPASDYLRGKVPYRDVFVLHGMLDNGLLDSWLMGLFGRQAEVALARLVVISALTVPMLWLIAMLMFDSIPLAMLTALLAYLIAGDNQRAVPQLLVVALLVLGLRRASTLAIFAAGAVAGAALFYGLDLGLYSVAGGTVALLLLAFFSPRPLAWSGWYVLGVMAGAAPFLLYLDAHGAVADFLQNSFVDVPSTIDAVWSIPFPNYAALFRDFSTRTVADFLLTEKFRFVLNPLILGVAAAFLLSRLVRRKPLSFVEGSFLVLSCFALLAQRSALGRADFYHQYFSAFLIPPILVLLVAHLAGPFGRVWSATEVGGRALLATLPIIALPVLFTILWTPDLLNARLDAVMQYRGRISAAGFRDLAGAQNAERLQALQVGVSRLTRLDEPVFDFSNQPALYFFTNRINPTRFYQVPIMSPIDFQMEAIEDLARTMPKVVFRKSPEKYDSFDGLTSEMRAPAVAAFLDDHYAYWQNLRGIELWRPFRPVRRSLDVYRRTFVLPASASRGPKHRVVFPVVGTIRTGAASHWKSDLLLYNPHTSPSQVRLRYLAGRTVPDQQLTLPAQKWRSIPNFAPALFGLPESLGVLWIEYPADRRPLARVWTYDDARPHDISLHPPLAETESATGNTLLNELVLVGIGAGTKLRVDLGVINIGAAPATFRVTVTDEKGTLTGGPIESELLEEGLYLMSDVGRELWVDFAEPAMIRVRMLSGTAIAFATLVNTQDGRREFISAVPTHAP